MRLVKPGAIRNRVCKNFIGPGNAIGWRCAIASSVTAATSAVVIYFVFPFWSVRRREQQFEDVRSSIRKLSAQPLGKSAQFRLDSAVGRCPPRRNEGKPECNEDERLNFRPAVEHFPRQLDRCR